MTSLELEVAEAPESDAGLGSAQLDSSSRSAIGVDVGEAIEILGRRKTAARVSEVGPADEGRGLLRVDGLVRKNLGVEVGDRVVVTRARPRVAARVGLSPALERGHLLSFGEGIQGFVTRALRGRLLTRGDRVIVPGIVLREGPLPFLATLTEPRGIVEIGEGTVVEVSEEPASEE